MGCGAADAVAVNGGSAMLRQLLVAFVLVLSMVDLVISTLFEE